MQDDSLCPIRAYGNYAQGYTNKLADAFYIVTSVIRQFVIGLALRCIGLPAFHFFINRFDLFQYVQAGRVFLEDFALIGIALADFDFIFLLSIIESAPAAPILHRKIFAKY